MSTDTTTLTQPEPSQQPAPRRRLHPLLIGAIAAVASVTAGTGAALVYAAVVGPERPEPEVELRFLDGDQDVPYAGEPGEPVPASHFPTLEGGPHLAFSSYIGTPLVINLWASTCPPCVQEMPALEQVHQELQGEVAFLGLAVRDPVEGSRAMVEETGVTYDIGLDRQGEVFHRLKAMVLPTTLFVDAEGKLVEAATGELTLEEIRAKAEALRG